MIIIGVNTCIKKRIIRKSPVAPYITSTLQCDAASKLNWPIKKTMLVAQRLYESGFITYMRTDSTILSEDILQMAEIEIKNRFGDKFHNRKQYGAKDGFGQEAHEAIRPTALNSNIDGLEQECKLLYNLIWKRTMSSQMSDSEIESSQMFLTTDDNNIFTMVGSKSRYIFKGYVILNDKVDDDIEDIIIPDFGNDIVVRNIMVKIKEYIDSPPQRYNESQMVKYITALGIGRPATYVNMITKGQEKDYIRCEDVDGKEKMLWEMTYNNINKEKAIVLRETKVFVGKEMKRLIPTELGIIVNDFLLENFPQIMDINFTANLEKQLDNIVNGHIDWLTVLHEFYDTLLPQIEKFKEKYNVIEKKDSKFINNTVITKYLGNDIVYFKSKFGFCLKYRCDDQDKDIYINVKKRPSIIDSIKLIKDKIDNVITESMSKLIKCIGKYEIKTKNDSNYIQVMKGKQIKFYPIYGIDVDDITLEQCKIIEEKYKSKIKKKVKKD